MRPPFVVDDAGDINVFSVLTEAERYLEPQDVDRPGCAIYDGAGTRLTAAVEHGLLRHRVKLSAPENAPVDPETLRARLSEYLVRVGEPVNAPASLSLDQLLDACMRRLRRRR